LKGDAAPFAQGVRTRLQPPPPRHRPPGRIQVLTLDRSWVPPQASRTPLEFEPPVEIRGTRLESSSSARQSHWHLPKGCGCPWPISWRWL